MALIGQVVRGLRSYTRLDKAKTCTGIADS